MNFKKALVVLGSVASVFAPAMAMAAETASGGGDSKTYAALAAALAIGLGAFGGALGQGKTAAAALEGIARNPSASGKVFVPMIIGLALIESLVLYAFVIAFLIKP
ncbi:ATP synthase F0 subunit C [bacterium]|nr:ATP synthase F0 subunit C [bacterium]